MLLTKRVNNNIIHHECLHADIIIILWAAIDNELSSASVRNNCVKLFVMVVMLRKLRRSREHLDRNPGKAGEIRMRVHLQGSCRYRRSMPCSRLRPARRAEREVSRIASRICYSTRKKSNLSSKMCLSSAFPPFRKSLHDRISPTSWTF